MNAETAIIALSALGQEGRLNIFRLLIQAGPEGMAAGRIAEQLDVPPNTLSANLNILSHAKLVTSRRDGRFIIYSARFEQMRDLIGFLIQDCCNGAPQLCAPLADLLTQAAVCDGC